MKRTVLLTALLLAAVLPAAAQMNYQGRLTDAIGNPLADGQQTLEFSLWTAATGGDQVWGPYSLDGSAGKPKADLVSGRFNVVIGAADPANRQLQDSFAGPRFIQIKVGTNAAISPRQQILAAPTALHAQKADTVNDGAIGTNQLANLAVTGDKIANNTIPVAKLTGAGANFWDGNGTSVWRTGGNVGIGTATPAEKLDVAGNLKVTGNATASGNVGIGTTTPTQKLDVIGNVNITANETPAGQFTIRSVNDAVINLAADTNNITETDNPVLRMTQDGGLRGVNIGFNETELPANIFGIGSIVNGTEDWGRFTVNVESGAVGIGTRATRALLEVAGGIDGVVNIGGFLNRNGASDLSNSDQSRSYSIYASSVIVGSEIFANSDARIKNIQGLTDGAADLVTLSRIEITDYTLKDVISKGNHPSKKVIAQQVEKVYPQAVSQTTDVVPDIYQKASVKDGWVTLATDLKVGERVRLIGEKSAGIHEVLEVGDGAFRTACGSTTESIFVYGREVTDFRNVDYDAIAMLNVSATQQLKKEKDAEVNALQDENRALRSALAAQERRLASLEAQDKTRDAKLARLEKLLDAATELQPVTTELSNIR